MFSGVELRGLNPLIVFPSSEGESSIIRISNRSYICYMYMIPAFRELFIDAKSLPAEVNDKFNSRYFDCDSNTLC